jgi:hypothetical protein
MRKHVVARSASDKAIRNLTGSDGWIASQSLQ